METLIKKSVRSANKYLMYYIGCYAMVEFGNQGVKKRKISNMALYSWFGKDYPSTCESKYYNIKPILKMLNKLTEDDYTQLGKWGVGGSSEVKYWLSQFEDYDIRENHLQKIREGLKVVNYTFSPEAFIYLTSNGYDIFELIINDLAVEAK